jgi:hypothetical protein
MGNIGPASWFEQAKSRGAMGWLHSTVARWLPRVLPLLGLAVVSALVASASLRHRLDHDESFFVASGVLLARQGLIPYRDFLFLHTPYLALLYAALFRVSGVLLLSSRLSSMAFAVAGLAVLLVMLWRELDGVRIEMRVLVATASMFVAATNPIVLQNVGLATNEDLAILCVLLALLAFLRGWRTSPDLRALFLSGLFAGLATGSRLPSAIVMAALFLLQTCDSLRAGPGRSHRGWLAFSAGGVLSLIPAGIVTLLAPSQSMFGLLQYHLLNSKVMASSGVVVGMGAPGKLAFILQLIAGDPRNVFLAFSLMAALAWSVSRPSGWVGFRTRTKLVGLVVLFVSTLGALANSPSQNQYFYPLIPLSVATLVFLLADKMEGRIAQGIVTLWLALLVVVGVGWSRLDFYKIRGLRDPSGWVPMIVHSEGVHVADLSGASPVLTLSPIFPLEGGGSIYSWESTGPFGWRVAPLLSPAERRSQHIVSASDLSGSLPVGGPATVLTGLEPDYESALVGYAKQNSYRPIAITSGLTLWIRPSAP